MKNVTVLFKKDMKMSDLIDADYHLLLLLTKMGISLGFGDKSVESVCKKNDFDVDCFLFLANFQAGNIIGDIQEEFNKLPLEPFLRYLNTSHTYFLENRLPNIRRKLEKVFSEEEKDMEKVVLSFFDNYMDEVNDHMVYENEVVIPYVRSLINRLATEHYSIDIFEERHNNIDNKVNELKSILMKYVSGLKDQKLMTNILMELYTTQEELETHTYIEDELIIPRVKSIESRK